jgi:hypothetical protein
MAGPHVKGTSHDVSGVSLQNENLFSFNTQQLTTDAVRFIISMAACRLDGQAAQHRPEPMTREYRRQLKISYHFGI